MEDIEKIIKESNSITDVLRKIGKYPNARNIQKYRVEFVSLGLDISHFSPNGSIKKDVVTKLCPVCTQLFESKTDEQITCSHSCSNTHFSDKRNKGKYRFYKTICFKHHKKKCVVCDEELIVGVHHYDGNHDNNDPINLVPMCPTHHQYWHSKYRRLVKEKVDLYRDKFILTLLEKQV